jgi:hypothetical protein
MGFFDRLRRRTVADSVMLGVLIEEQSLLLATTSVRDYSRLRAGKGADALFANAAFAADLERAQWEAYPRALEMVGQVVEAMLRPHAGANAHLMLENLAAIVTGIFDCRAVPSPITEAQWRAERAQLIRSLGALSERAPLPVESVADAQASWFLAIMPLYGRDDFPALRARLRALLLQVQGAIAERIDLPGLAQELAAQKLAAQGQDAAVVVAR